MLVIARQLDEEWILDFTKATDSDIAALRAGELITCQLTEIRGVNVRQGITAPKSVQIHRREYYNAMKRAAEAAKTQGEKTP